MDKLFSNEIEEMGIDEKYLTERVFEFLDQIQSFDLDTQIRLQNLIKNKATQYKPLQK